MTPEKRTYHAVVKILAAREAKEPGPIMTHVILEAIEAAEADMVERCAQIAESESRSWDSHAPYPQARIAAKIRALKR